jgi:hypothetical protein
VRLKVFATVNIWILVLWVMPPHSFVHGYECFGRTCCPVFREYVSQVGMGMGYVNVACWNGEFARFSVFHES